MDALVRLTALLLRLHACLLTLRLLLPLRSRGSL